jgi:hypothetical protein
MFVGKPAKGVVRLAEELVIEFVEVVGLVEGLVEGLVKGLKSVACQRICTLYAITPSNPPFILAVVAYVPPDKVAIAATIVSVE